MELKFSEPKSIKNIEGVKKIRLRIRLLLWENKSRNFLVEF